MAREYGGPYLYLKPDKRTGATWVIRDRARVIACGAKPDEREKAETAIERYVRETYPGGVVMRQRLFKTTAPARQSVYFISCDAPDFPIKIGVAGNISQRIMQMQQAMPFQMVLLGSMPGSLKSEKLLHTAFAHLWLRGEWFRRDPELLAYIANLPSPTTNRQIFENEHAPA